MTIGITGHQHIPAPAIALVEARIRAILSAAGSPRCVSSLASGADQLFAQLALDCAATLHVVIPSRHYEATFTSELDRERYYALLRQASTTELLPFQEPSEEAFLRAGMRVTDLSDQLIAVWDGEAAVGKGGTADVVMYARQLGKYIVIAWPAGLKR